VLGSLVIAHHSGLAYDLFKFRRLRLNIVGFLRLPLDISESSLLQSMKACSASLFAHYLNRAECARRSWDSRPTEDWKPARSDSTESGPTGDLAPASLHATVRYAALRQAS
jgi:hypothetical protein